VLVAELVQRGITDDQIVELLRNTPPPNLEWWAGVVLQTLEEAGKQESITNSFAAGPLLKGTFDSTCPASSLVNSTDSWMPLACMSRPKTFQRWTAPYSILTLPDAARTVTWRCRRLDEMEVKPWTANWN
jgi:hypothetical protein